MIGLLFKAVSLFNTAATLTGINSTPPPQIRIRNGGVHFDRSVIRRNWNKINRGPLARAGLLVRKIARNSIRRGKPGGKPTLSGTPPKSRAADAPLKRIYSVPNDLGTSVIVGPVGFGGFNPATALHEHGGRASRKVLLEKKQSQQRDSKGRFQRVEINKKRILKSVSYPPRPFMQPALLKAAPQLPRLWAESIRT